MNNIDLSWFSSTEAKKCNRILKKGSFVRHIKKKAEEKRKAYKSIIEPTNKDIDTDE